MSIFVLFRLNSQKTRFLTDYQERTRKGQGTDKERTRKELKGQKGQERTERTRKDEKRTRKGRKKDNRGRDPLEIFWSFCPS
jgi:hypothetical protein